MLPSIRPTVLTIALSLTAVAVLGACGSSSKTVVAPTTAGAGAVTSTSQPAVTTTAAAGTATSCSVITQSEAGAALGQPVRAPVLGKATVEGGVACVFYGPGVPNGADPDVALPGSVRVVLVTGAQASFYFNDYKSKVHAQVITGYGDQAFYDGGASFSVLQGDDYLRVAVVKADNLAPEEMLATDALARL